MILLLARLKVPLAAAILAGAVAIGAMCGLDAQQIAETIGTGIIQPRTLGLVAITITLLALSGTMQAGGQMAEIVRLARTFLRRPAVTMAALPALIGLLPMPGGAIFSAPMVASAAGSGKVGGEKLSAVNYWYRHVWEHFWPLYPGVILAVTLTGNDFMTFAAFQWPLCVFMVAAGLLVLRRMDGDLHVRGPVPPVGTKRKLLRATAPIWIIFLVWLAETIALKLLPDSVIPESMRDVIKYAPVTMGLAVSLVWTSFASRLDRRSIARVWTNRNIYAMAVLVTSVMVLQYTFARIDVAAKIGRELEVLRVPVMAMVIILPFIAGMVTGLAIGFVGTSFPIVLGLVAAMPEQVSIYPYVVLAYAFGHLGQMLSPLHLCHVVSNKYFNTPFAPVYREIGPSAVVVAAASLAYFAALRAFMG